MRMTTMVGGGEVDHKLIQSIENSFIRVRINKGNSEIQGDERQLP